MIKTHMRVHMTLVGYSLGELKVKESKLIRQRGVLQTRLAQLTSKQSLEELVKTPR